MNWLKSLLNTTEINRPDQGRPALPPMHDRHLHFLDETFVENPVQNILQSILSSQESKAIFCGRFAHIIDSGEDLMMSVLIDNEQTLTLLPFFETNKTWPLRIKRMLSYEGKSEGILEVEVNDQASIGFYDHFYFANSKTYCRDEFQYFAVSGLCYSISVISQLERFSQSSTGYFPVSADEHGSEDEVRFFSTVLKVREFEFYGVAMIGLEVCLARLDGFDMYTTLFVSRSKVTGPLNVGDLVTGIAWMFGHKA